jgi:hypothetical protein
MGNLLLTSKKESNNKNSTELSVNEPITETVPEPAIDQLVPNQHVPEKNDNQLVSEPKVYELNNKKDDIDWDDIDKSVNDFVAKIQEMKENGLFNISEPKIIKTLVIDEDW